MACFFVARLERAAGHFGSGVAGVGCPSSSRPVGASGRWSVGGGLLLVGALAWSAAGAPVLLPPAADVLAVMTRVNDYWIATQTTPMGNNRDPAARRLAVHATVATQEGGWAALGRLSGRGYGQQLAARIDKTPKRR